MACAGQEEPLARIGSGALSLADPMEPPPSVVPGRGNGPEGTPDRLGLSSPTATWQASDEGAGQGRHAVAPCAPRGVARAHRGSGCHGLPRRIHPTRLGSAWPAGVSSAMTAGWTTGNRGSLDHWPERRTIASLARRGGGPRIGRIDAVHNGRRWRRRAGGTPWVGGVFCTIMVPGDRTAI